MKMTGRLLGLCGWAQMAPRKKRLRERIRTLLSYAGTSLVSVPHAVVKARFWTRIGVTSSLAICGFEFTKLRLINPIIGLVPILAFLPLTEIFVAIYYYQWLDNFKLLIPRKISWQPLPPELESIAKRLGIKNLKFGMRKGLRNAYVSFNRVVFGEELWNDLSAIQREAVFAHEVFHKKRHHTLWLLLAYGLTTLWFLVFIDAPYQIALVTFVAFATLTMTAARWIIELDADLRAGEVVGFENMVDTLIALDGNLQENTESHPSIEARIRRLRRGSGDCVGRWGRLIEHRYLMQDSMSTIC